MPDDDPQFTPPPWLHAMLMELTASPPPDDDRYREIMSAASSQGMTEDEAVLYSSRQRQAQGERGASASDDETINIYATPMEIFERITQALKRSGRVFRIGSGDTRKIICLSANNASDEMSRLTPAQCAIEVMRHARVVKMATIGRGAARETVMLDTNLPDAITKQYFETQYPDSLSEIRGVSPLPTITEDGSLITTPRARTHTRLLLAGTVPHFTLPDHVTQEDALEAYNEIADQLLFEYEFSEPEDKVASMALLMTAALRYSMHLAPMFAVVAGVPRTGKDHLCQTAAHLATGQAAHPTSLSSGTREEVSRDVQRILLQAGSFNVISNVNRRVYSDELCVYISEGTLIGRVYGFANEPRRAYYYGMLVMNGNGLVLADDLASRSIVINLFSRSRLPSDRTFTFDPHAWLQDPENRARILRGFFLIAKWWKLNGTQSESNEGAHSFLEWSRLVREPLKALTDVDVLQSMKESEEDAADEREGGSAADALMAIFQFIEHREPRKYGANLIKQDDGSFVFIAGVIKQAMEQVTEWHREWTRQEHNGSVPEDLVDERRREAAEWDTLQRAVSDLEEMHYNNQRRAGHRIKRDCNVFGGAAIIRRQMDGRRQNRCAGTGRNKPGWLLLPVEAVADPAPERASER